MNRIFSLFNRRRTIASMVTIIVLLGCAAAWAQVAVAPRGMVATVRPEATDAAVAVMREGGNAVDAAVTAALTLGVVDGHNSGIGGGCFILIRRADGELFAIDGRETAPAKAHRDMYLRDGQVVPEWSRTGALASGVPGALAAYALAVERHGRLPLESLLAPGVKLAEEGFTVDDGYAARLSREAKALASFSGSKGALLKPDGSPYQQGEVLRQPDLARTYRSIAEHGPAWFYRGPFAQTVDKWMKENGGIMTAEDFAAYEAKLREPLISSYRGHTIVGFPPPSSGGVHVAQILNILETFDLRLERQSQAATMHVVAEAMKAAFADRAFWLGDPDFTDVPRGLIDAAYARQLAERIDPERVVSIRSHGQPPRADSDLFGKHTTHIAAADADGNWVAITATVNTTFGSKVVIPGTGVVMNNQMEDFSIHPGVPNVFGLIGAEANAVEPGKRPLSSMSPTIVLKDGQPVLTLGAAGGPRIITQVVLAIVRRLDFDASLVDAVGEPRFHHQWSPDRLYVEEGVAEEFIDELKRLGHSVATTQQAGVTQAIEYDAERKLFLGVHDPRVAGKAAGY